MHRLHNASVHHLWRSHVSPCLRFTRESAMFQAFDGEMHSNYATDATLNAWNIVSAEQQKSGEKGVPALA